MVNNLPRKVEYQLMFVVARLFSERINFSYKTINKNYVSNRNSSCTSFKINLQRKSKNHYFC